MLFLWIPLILLILEPVATYLWDAKSLRRFPNATYFSGITNLSYIFQRWRGFRSREIHEAHKKHPILRVGPNTVSFSSPEAIRTIYGHNTVCVKGGTYVTAAGPHPSMLDVVSRDEHGRKRRILSHAFATRNLELWEFKVADKVQRLVNQFDRICSQGPRDSPPVLEYRKWSNLFTIEAIVDIALSQKLGCLDKGSDLVTLSTPDGETRHINYIDCLHGGKRILSTFIWSTTWYKPWKSVLEAASASFRSQWDKGRHFDEMVRLLVHRRIQQFKSGEQFDDLIGCLLSDKQGRDRELPVGEIESEANTLLDAGSDTTAIQLTHVMYLLLKNPSVLATLRQEVDAVFSSGEDIATYAQVRNLPFLRACLDESLRLFPPVAFGLNRQTPPEGLMIDGHWIPGKTLVGVPAYTAHRNLSVFPDAETFDPGRWLRPGSKEAQGSFIPFSAGARGCIGRNITYIEQTILVATLVHRYDLGLLDPGLDLRHEEGFNLWPGPLPVTIKRREAHG